MLKEGLKYSNTSTVNKNNTAQTLGSGDMEVFATPAMVALMENAAMKTVADYLPQNSTTVGSLINVSHIKPSGLGETIETTAILTTIEGRKLTFEVKATDSNGTIGEGTHIRFVVDREKFLSKL